MKVRDKTVYEAIQWTGDDDSYQAFVALPFVVEAKKDFESSSLVNLLLTCRDSVGREGQYWLSLNDWFIINDNPAWCTVVYDGLFRAKYEEVKP